MKNTLCLLVVLALIAQICAMPADREDEKDVKGAADQAAGVKDKATKGATDAANKATGDATDAADKATGAAADLKNKGEHGPAKHGGNGEDGHKPGTHRGPISHVMKGTEEMGKKIADASVNTVIDFMKIFGL